MGGLIPTGGGRSTLLLGSLAVAGHPQLRRHFIHTRPLPDSLAGVDYQGRERLDGAGLARLLEGIGCWFAEKWIELRPDECDYYLCGPEAFVQQVRLMLAELGVPPQAIFQESFGGGSGALEGLQLSAAEVRFQYSQCLAQWCQDDDLSLLELAERAGLNPEFSCRSGRCGLCRAPLLQGAVVYPRPPSVDVPSDEVLLCCALPQGDLVLGL